MAKTTLTMKYWSDGSPSADMFDDSDANCKNSLTMGYWSDGQPAIDLYEPAGAPPVTGVKDFMKFF